ncbi:MAG: hypothetical protein EBS87_11910, partial [Sphingomonadaceae bacterium]|nr:hypothetical protein [Sphingomonadaceae bacterium]
MNIRQPGPEAGAIDLEPIHIDFEEPEDREERDEEGNLLSIEHADGSITVSLDDNPLERADNGSDGDDWWDNLVDKIDADELSRISADLMRGIDDDLLSRKDWIENRAQGVKLLGLKIEVPSLQ